jgi:hypothetical protein
MSLLRRRETLNEQLVREAELDAPREQAPVQADRDSTPHEPSLLVRFIRAVARIGYNLSSPVAGGPTPEDLDEYDDYDR